ncbi:MAG TPA: cytochrome c oxidase subunit II [Alphaproteobacteria bacterium]|nr:cytochrome c oxidase subunit II [Alphaproteobacteria bacterium]
MSSAHNFCRSIAAGLIVLATAGSEPALAQMPQDWQLHLQPPATPVMERLYDFHILLLWIISGISIFVLGLLLYAIFRFRESRNPVPSRTTHHTLVEVVWTVVPVLILVVIAVPSLRILYFSDRVESVEMTIKAIGHQWYWSYEYPDHGNFTFDALMKSTEELEHGEPRLLATDNRVVLPVGTNIRVLITADDVLHAWAVPSFGVKRDAVPGRINEVWMRIDREGVYYGQCSELCGKDHAFMPIMVEAVSKERFQEWVSEAQAKFARVDGAAPAALALVPSQSQSN